MFWRITNNCQSQVLFLDLPLWRFHNKRQKVFHFQQSSRERVETFSFSNRLDDIIMPLLGDKWLNENDPNMKLILKTKSLEKFSAEWDHFWNPNMTILFIMMIPCYSCITAPLFVTVFYSSVLPPLASHSYSYRQKRTRCPCQTNLFFNYNFEDEFTFLI
jgi:hypothetical protein